MDIIFSVLLTVFSIYLFIYIGGSADATPTELGAAFWPRIVLGLMIVLLAVNTVQILKDMKSKGTKATDGINLKDFFKSKLFIGMILIAVMALIMPAIGFVPTCFIFLMAYGYLLGEKNFVRLAVFSCLITILLYVVFQGFLSIMLARGTGIFRSFALVLESLLPF